MVECVALFFISVVDKFPHDAGVGCVGSCEADSQYPYLQYHVPVQLAL